MRALPAAALLALAACATASPERRTAPGDAAARIFQGTVAGGAEGGYETGRLAATGALLTGPFVLTFLSPGAELELVAARGSPARLGVVTGPLAQPFPLSAGLALRLSGQGEAVYAGYRAMPMTRALEAWVGRQIWLGEPGAAAPEQWWLREVGGDHLTVERNRTYRVLPLGRVLEIAWTDLTGIDPAPRVLLAPR